MIKNLSVRNFRNYANLNIRFTEKINILTGPNGVGKTNILEAVFFLSMLRSFRTASIKDLQRIGKREFYLSATADTGQGWDQFLEVEYTDIRKLRIDSIPIRKASEFIGTLQTVAFSPSDIMLITESTPLRRRFINMLISSFDKSYLTALNHYTNALKSRNTLLKEGSPDPQALTAFEQVMAAQGTVIVNRRREVTELLSREMLSIITEIKGGDPVFSLKYNFHPATSVESSYISKLADERHREALRGYTTFGPHLDDCEFILEDKSLRHFGSAGQCRLAAICLKMAAVNIINNIESGNHKVITLVDDVTGELDEKTRSAFFNVINNSEQAFFTFTAKPDDDYFANAETFSIMNGQILKS